MKGFFERSLLSARLFVFLPVIFSMLSAIILFLVATVDIISMMSKVVASLVYHSHLEAMHAFIVGEIIGAVDLYLIAVVLLIFSFGLYELFICEVDDDSEKAVHVPAILSISSLDQLKDKLAKVIVMVLVVSYFKRVFYISYNGPLDMMYFALSITALSVGVYLMHKDAKHKKAKESKQS